ncbi:MAG: acetyl-CoA carboxylase, carboxyltransferase subunit beta [Crocinitomicaceae bacterium]|nr:acetyl-CoA carboxylase, carboxyltransferase subunit beta [Crocinitomicaceae bacterium]
MSWFKRNKEGITTTTSEKKEVPEGLWSKCSNCKTIFTKGDLEKLNYVCNRCSHHERIGSEEYFSIIFDKGKYSELNAKVASGDPLEFEDTKKYVDRVKSTQVNTGLTDAIRTAKGKLNKKDLIIAAMDFRFIGGSMGSVMGEKVSRAIDEAIKLKCPVIVISKSGGARMMEAGFSLMQMAKISGKLGQLADAGLPYVSYLTDPTTGGVTASFAMLGDINIAEPGALIAFAGPRVVKETIGRDLPAGFQTSEFLLDHGFLDFIIDRTKVRERLSLALELFSK